MEKINMYYDGDNGEESNTTTKMCRRLEHREKAVSRKFNVTSATHNTFANIRFVF